MSSLRVSDVWEQPADLRLAGVDGLPPEGHMGHWGINAITHVRGQI